MSKKTILVSGGFDPPHIGHVRMFKEAAEWGTVIVAINSDEWLMRKKGYVFMPWEQRAEIIKDVDTILNNLETLSTRIQENIQNLSNDLKEGVEIDPLVIEAVQSLGVINEADEPSKLMDILFYAPKARKAMAKVNKIKDNQMAMDLAADNLNSRDEKEKKQKEKD